MKNIWLIFLFLAIFLFLSGCIKEPTEPVDNPSPVYPTTYVNQSIQNKTNQIPGGCAYNNPSCDNNHSCINNACVLKKGCSYNNPPCNDQYDCTANQCILSYESTRMQIKEKDLPYVNYQSDGPVLQENERALSLFDKFLVIYPDKEFFIDIAETKLVDSYFCYQKIKDYVGIEPDPLIDTNYVIEKIYLSDASSSSASRNAIISSGPISYWQSYKNDIIPLSKNYIKNGICGNDHEMTHLFVANTPIYHWLNEGLATYIEYKVGYQKDQNLSDICRDNEILYPYYGNSYYYPPDAPKNYMNLEFYDQKYPKTLYYYTGACFWYEIENKYGHDKFKDIMTNLAVKRTQKPETIKTESCSKFIEIFESGLGEQIPDRFLIKYGLERGDVVSSEDCGT